MSEQVELKQFPAIRCRSGDWIYYLTVMPYYEIANRIRRATDFVEQAALDGLVQRALSRRVQGIVRYLRQQEERFFNSVVVGVIGGNPKWYTVTPEASPVLRVPDLHPRFENTLGILELDGTERLFAIDGQHRVEAIRLAIDGREDLRDEDLSVIFVSADIEGEERERIRRMFSTLNRYAKPVSAMDKVALDEDDAAAIVTRLVVREYGGLNKEKQFGRQTLRLVHFGHTMPIPVQNSHSITSILAVYDIIKEVSRGTLKRVQPRNKQTRPSDFELDEIQTETIEFWERLGEHLPAIATVLGSDPSRELAAQYRNRKGGHVMFRPAGQQAFARALSTLMARGRSLNSGIEELSKTAMQLSEPPWLQTMWDSGRGRMITQHKTLYEALFLHMVGESPRTATYNLLQQYRRSLDDDTEELPILR